jgi:translocation and assembly module TamB
MPDADAISYLVTGRPPQPGGGGSQMAGAAALLGSNVLSSAVGSKLGLDEAQVETGGSLDEAALVTGKYLTPNFYISYAMGLFDRSNLVRLRYILSPNWAVQTETGSTQGADVFYEFERGGPRR